MRGKARVKIPAGTQSGQVFRLRGQGFQHLRSHGEGDQIVQVIVETPRKLSSRQEELYRELATIDEKTVNPQRSGFMDRLKKLFNDKNS